MAPGAMNTVGEGGFVVSVGAGGAHVGVWVVVASSKVVGLGVRVACGYNDETVDE